MKNESNRIERIESVFVRAARPQDSGWMYFVEVVEVPRVMERERKRRTDVESSRAIVLEKILRFVFMRMSASITSHVFVWSIDAS
jgi:hypothetical protein